MSAVAGPPGEAGEDGTEPPSDDLLAAELVLGVLDSSQRRSVQARADSDRAFAERVAYWERRFAPWLSDIEPVEPPARVWTRVCERLGWQDRESGPASLRGALVFWRAVAALSVLVAVVAIWALLQRSPQTPPVAGQPQGQAQTAGEAVTPLWHDDGTPGWLVSIDRAHETVFIVPVPAPGMPAPANTQGRVPELWVIPAGKAPRSLGLVSNNRAWTVTVPEDARAAMVAGSVLAVSLETAAGAPHAAPAGPIVAKGSI
jgi:anti-sigma-K factor RskA